VPLRELSSVLWQERQLVERGAVPRWALHIAELDRAVLVRAVAAKLDLDDDVSLRELAARLPAPWPTVFVDHHEALAAADHVAIPRSLAEFLR